MTPLLLAFALLCAQDPKPPPPDDAHELQKNIETREARRPALERKIREAVDRGDDAGARALNQEFKDNDQEIESLRKRLAEAKPQNDHWLSHVRITGEAMLTTFDNRLHLHDGFGFGGALSFGPHLYVEYQRWEADDERGGGEAVLQSYQLGLRADHGRAEEGEVTFTMAAAFGIAHASSSSAGTSSDSGPMLTFRPECRYHFNTRASFGIGGDFDYFWTSFNNKNTHTRINQSLLFSIEAAF